MKLIYLFFKNYFNNENKNQNRLKQQQLKL
jgi:hypothetical protein